MNDTPTESGGGRKQQLKNWSQFFDISKIGSKYVVNKMYDSNEIQLIEKKGKFTTYIENLLIENLAQSEEKFVTMTYREILESLWMVNEKYYPAKYDKIHVIQDVDYSLSSYDSDNSQDLIMQNISMFFNISNRLLKRIVDDALKSMRQRSLIGVAESFRLFRKRYDEKTNLYYTESRDCTEQECIKIRDIQYDAMKFVGISKTNQLVYLDWKNRQRYMDFITERIQDEFGYEFYAKSLILSMGDSIKKEYQSSLSKNRLNANVKQKLLTAKEMQIISSSLNTQLVEKFISK